MKHKKRILLLLTTLLCLVTLGLSIFTACDRKDGLGDETQYSVSVELPDGTGASGVTVAFSIGDKTYQTAQTDNNGLVQVTLYAGEYDVSLTNLPEGYSYEGGVKTNRLGTPLSITLVQNKTTYTATVSYSGGEKDGTKADGVTVIWSKAGATVAQAETNEQGVAGVELGSDTYSVTVENIPDGYWLENALTMSEQTSTLNISLTVDPRVKFTVTSQTEGGMGVRDVRLSVYNSNQSNIYNVVTNNTGSVSFRLPEGDYTMFVNKDAVAKGLTYQGENSYTINGANNNVSLTFSSAVIETDPPANKKYVLGDIMYDFAFAAYDDTWTGEGDNAQPDNPLVLSDLLSDANKDGKQDNTLVVINFWYTTCSWCIREFPCLVEAYEAYKDKGVKVIAIDPMAADSAAVINSFRQQYMGQFNLTFPIVRDSQLVNNFVLQGYPTTVFIDRYGAVARIESGAITETEIWTDLFDEFIADDYRQTFTPGDEYSEPEEFVPDIPDVNMPASSEIEAAINNTQSGFNFSYYPEAGTDDAKYAWPFVVGEYDNKNVIKPANSGYRTSYSIIHSDVTLKKGDVLAFDFFSSCEKSDILYVLVDDLVIWQISGVAEQWDTCFAYVALKDGTHKLTLLYMKDSTVNSGDDAVYVTNMRITTESEINKQTDILRECATDMNESETAYNNYVTPVFDSEEGYYHVGAANGPYILADLFHATNWNTKSIYELYVEKLDASKAFSYDLDGDGKKEDCTELLVEYLNLATKSDFYGLVPVDATLKALLNAITDEYSENHTDREWLEVCKYYSRYGAEGEVPLPTLGLNVQTAIAIDVSTEQGGTTFTFQTNRVIFPLNSLVYKFTPSKTGVYRFRSLSTEDNYQTQAWLYLKDKTVLAYSGDDLLGSTADDDDGINFCIYYYLTAGETYYLECAFYWNDDTTAGKPFNFNVEYMGTHVTIMTNAASGYFTTSGEDLTGDIILAEAIDTILDDGIYYHKNADGTKGNVIYIDVNTPTRANEQLSLKQISERSLYSKDENKEHVSVFNFTDDYYKDLPAQYKHNYSETIKTLIANPDPETGYVVATKELVEILQAYAQAYLFGVENAWLQFAYYEKEIGVKPAEDATQTQTLYTQRREEI